MLSGLKKLFIALVRSYVLEYSNAEWSPRYIKATDGKSTT